MFSVNDYYFMQRNANSTAPALSSESFNAVRVTKIAYETRREVWANELLQESRAFTSDFA